MLGARALLAACVRSFVRRRAAHSKHISRHEPGHMPLYWLTIAVFGRTPGQSAESGALSLRRLASFPSPKVILGLEPQL